MFAAFTPEPASFYVMAGTVEYYAALERLRSERRAARERLFHAELLRAKVTGNWLTIDESANLTVSRYSRYADLIIAGQDNPDDPESYVADHFRENLIMTAGLPVLMVPYAGTFPTVGTHALIAWDASREATRALHDALPFLKRATKATVITIGETKGEPLRGRIPGSDIAAVIARHGVNVEVSDLGAADRQSVGDLLLSQASDLGADLIIMGGYGHARWHEFVMGGATRTVLKSMTVPVLMSH